MPSLSGAVWVRRVWGPADECSAALFGPPRKVADMAPLGDLIRVTQTVAVTSELGDA